MSTTCVALLRGVNVGGHRKIAMSDLRALLEKRGYADVVTYVQSGNAVFTTDAPGTATVEAAIEKGIAAELGLDVTVLVRTRAELADVVAANPWPDLVDTPTLLHVAFVSAQPDAERLATLDPSSHAPDEMAIGNRALYLHYPSGSGRARLTQAMLERTLGQRGQVTARNWRTVTKLLQLAS